MPADFLCPKGGGAIYFRIEKNWFCVKNSVLSLEIDFMLVFLLSARKLAGNR